MKQLRKLAAVLGIAPLYHFLLAFLAAFIYRFPSKNIFVIGVTGTKGKTTTVELVNAVLEAAGERTALLSSIRIKIGDRSEKNTTGNTMPGRFFIQRFLRQAVRAGCKYAILEVTSQGVLHSRHRFISWSAGVLTHVAPEHIESHGTFEKYRAAKLAFLTFVALCGGRVFANRDDTANVDYFDRELEAMDVTWYSKSDPVTRDFRPRDAQLFFQGDFNRENIAAAVSVCRSLGVPPAAVLKALEGFKGVPGRMEFVQEKPFAVVVDYAHTPASLEAVYKTLKPRNARMLCVLGACGGGRDKWKRPEMGKIAGEYCDKVFLTDEDPYDENPREIIEQIRSGIPRFRIEMTTNVLDRREAIAAALKTARPGDVVVMTGKGSESWIHGAKGKKIPWNERGVAEEILRSLKKE